MVGVQINLSIGWVHQKSTHVILHTHFVKFQALAFESTIFLLVYKLLYKLATSFFDNHRYHLSLWWTYCVEPTSLGVLLTSSEPVFVLGVSFGLFSSSFVMFSLGLCGFGIVLSSLSSNSIISTFAHVVESSSSTSLVIVFASTN